LENRYVYGTSLDDVLIQVTSGGTVTFYHANHQGSIIAISNSSGAVANKNLYGPFGETTSLSGTTFGFTGQRYESDSGLYYFKFRYYNPTIGRFMQPDPIRYARGLNLYTYAQNDPTDQSDPLGLAPIPTDPFWGPFWAGFWNLLGAGSGGGKGDSGGGGQDQGPDAGFFGFAGNMYTIPFYDPKYINPSTGFPYLFGEAPLGTIPVNPSYFPYYGAPGVIQVPAGPLGGPIQPGPPPNEDAPPSPYWDSQGKPWTLNPFREPFGTPYYIPGGGHGYPV